MNASGPVMDLPQAHDLAARMRVEIAKALVGQEAVVEQVIVAFLAGGHVLLRKGKKDYALLRRAG